MEFYGIALEEPATFTLLDVLLARLGGDHVEPGARLHLAGVDLVVRNVQDGVVDGVGFVIRPPDDPDAGPATPQT